MSSRAGNLEAALDELYKLGRWSLTSTGGFGVGCRCEARLMLADKSHVEAYGDTPLAAARALLTKVGAHQPHAVTLKLAGRAEVDE